MQWVSWPTVAGLANVQPLLWIPAVRALDVNPPRAYTQRSRGALADADRVSWSRVRADVCHATHTGVSAYRSPCARSTAAFGGVGRAS